MSRKPDILTAAPQLQREAMKAVYKRVASLREDLFDVIDRLDDLVPRQAYSELRAALQDANTGLGDAERGLMALFK